FADICPGIRSSACASSSTLALLPDLQRRLEPSLRRERLGSHRKRECERRRAYVLCVRLGGSYAASDEPGSLRPCLLFNTPYPQAHRRQCRRTVYRMAGG